MKTYVQRLMELKDYAPENMFFTTGEEVARVRQALGLEEMHTELELRNMRDMTVLYYDSKIDRALEHDDKHGFNRLMNAMQSITAVIDDALIRMKKAV